MNLFQQTLQQTQTQTQVWDSAHYRPGTNRRISQTWNRSLQGGEEGSDSCAEALSGKNCLSGGQNVVCLSVCLSVYLAVYLSVCLSK